MNASLGKNPSVFFVGGDWASKKNQMFPRQGGFPGGFFMVICHCRKVKKSSPSKQTKGMMIV